MVCEHAHVCLEVCVHIFRCSVRMYMCSGYVCTYSTLGYTNVPDFCASVQARGCVVHTRIGVLGVCVHVSLWGIHACVCICMFMFRVCVQVFRGCIYVV